ncbi:MAG TPA: ABC transporter permease [candidate division Zixibacteria bacterium]|nr:ABC transporter permease [candidate division Zixibacteria bacterium]
MKVFKLISRNTTRHPLRSFLTVLGLAIAVMAFAVIRTTISAWYAGAQASSPNRLVVINRVSLVFTLPLADREKIEKVDGVTGISWAQWFGGIYVDPKNFFAQFAVDPGTYFKLYPEYIIPPDQMETFQKERNAVIVGRALADRFGWSVGDPIRLTGTIYPGNWDFVIRGIYTGAKEGTDESQFFMHFNYLDERMKQETPGRAGQVGSFIVRIADPSQAAQVSDRIDALFKNSLAETKTQTEEAFQLSFVAMAGTIVTGLRIISILVIAIILLVLANTMAMTARERISEYAVMKTLGFSPFHIVGLIFGESLFIAALGGTLGILITFPIAGLIKVAMGAFFPIFKIHPVTLAVGFVSALFVGLLAAIFPAVKAVRTSIVDGLRIID